ncbi:LysR family transcriptional regulator [Paenibacillus sp. PAMC21692]|uniref:LysR family transcriptional regulator n=1 Tax=Paenibacillus sp. PAMC21692 TaxID=2762320 RepID=UPI00164DC4BF|nr:LysR family transcriptional regulator [Paenibacillus sp. PAMC21692]QNK58428.1 LysR family transcriptional regulator [Paenibacillus sp. PAMC21692]
MTIQQLKVLLEICKGKTLLETAEKLGLTQPTVSFHLRKLEEVLGLELVRKTSRKLRPTEAALELLPYIRRIVFLGGELEEHAAQLHNRGGGRLKLGASYTPATYLLPAFFSAFQEEYPSIQLQLTVKKAGTIMAMLRNYELDAAVVSLPNTPEPGLSIQPLLEDELRLVVAPGHRLVGRREIEAEDLQGERLLLHEPGSTSRTLTEEWMNQTEIIFNHSMELGAIETMKEAVKCSLGIAVLPERSVIKEVAAGELIQFRLPNYLNRRYISFVCRADEQLPHNARLFADFITNHFGDQKPLQK